MIAFTLVGGLRVEHRRPRYEEDDLQVGLLRRAHREPAEPVHRLVGPDLEAQVLGVEALGLVPTAGRVHMSEKQPGTSADRCCRRWR